MRAQNSSLLATTRVPPLADWTEHRAAGGTRYSWRDPVSGVTHTIMPSGDRWTAVCSTEGTYNHWLHPDGSVRMMSERFRRDRDSFESTSKAVRAVIEEVARYQSPGRRHNPTASGGGPKGDEDSRGRLPFPVIYSVVGILLKGRPRGTVTRLTKRSLGGAIGIAINSRKKQGFLRTANGKATRELTKAGEDWVKQWKRDHPGEYDEVMAEFERLREITKAPPKKKGPRASVPRREADKKPARKKPSAKKPKKPARKKPTKGPAKKPRAKKPARKK